MNNSRQHWVTALAASELPVRQGREVIVADRVIGLFRIGEQVYAIDGTCPHHGGPLGQGELRDFCVVCPWHGLTVDVTNGEYHLGVQANVTTYPVRCRDGLLQVCID